MRVWGFVRCRSIIRGRFGDAGFSRGSESPALGQVPCMGNTHRKHEKAVDSSPVRACADNPCRLSPSRPHADARPGNARMGRDYPGDAEPVDDYRSVGEQTQFVKYVSIVAVIWGLSSASSSASRGLLALHVFYQKRMHFLCHYRL